MRNKWPAVLSAKGGGPIPTTAQTHIPEAVQGDMAREVHRTPLHRPVLAYPRLLRRGCWEQSPVPAPTTALPVMYGALDPALGVGRRAAKA